MGDVMNYSEQEMQKIISEIFDTIQCKISPIGNHNLNRHLVYKVTLPEDTYIIKFYYKWNRRNREIAAHKVLESSTDVKLPKMISYGVLDDGREWMAYEFIEGCMLDEIQPDLDEYELEYLFEEMGEQLGKIHSAKQFNYFGDWDENGQSLHEITSFKQCFIRRQESHVQTLRKFALPEKRMLEAAIALMREFYCILDPIHQSRLCHRDFDGRNILVVKGRVRWEISGIIDFEQSSPYYTGSDLVNLYRKYFIDFPNLEKAFFVGYERFHQLDPYFVSLKDYMLLCLGVAICSWSYDDARPHYYEGIRILEFLRAYSRFEF